MSIEAIKLALEALEDATKHIFLGDKNGVEANIRAHKQCESLRQAIAELESQEQWGVSAVMKPEYVAEQQKKTEELRSMLESQKPVAWRAPNWGHSADEYVYRDFDNPVIGIDGKPSPNNEPLYTTPQPKHEQGYKDGYEAGWTKALNEAYSNREQEPVAWVNKERNTITWDKLYPDMDALYETPQRKPLTDVLLHLFQEWKEDHLSQSNYIDAVAQIKAAHGIKE
jgi:hypothetical protein